MKKSFLYSLHWFRGVAIIFVVLSHSVPKLDGTHELAGILQSIFYNGTVFFVFISGYLFWHLKDRFEYRRFILDKFKYVLSPYAVMLSIAIAGAVIASHLGLGQIGSQNVSVSFISPFAAFEGVVWHFWVGTSILVPLWFIPFIFLVFISSWFIYKAAESSYFGYIAFIGILLAIFTHRPDLKEYPYLFTVLMYVHYIGIFLFGILMRQHQEFVYKNAVPIVIVSGVLFFATELFYSMTVVNYISGFTSIPLLNRLDLTQLKMIFGVLFFLGLLFVIEQRIKSRGDMAHGVFLKTLDVLAHYSFGIFFLHTFALKFLEKVHEKLFGSIDNLLSLAVVSVFTFLITMFVIYSVRKVFHSKSRYLVGS